MKCLRLATLALVCLIVSATAARAAPITFRLRATTPLFADDPKGAPLPLGRTAYEAGNVLLDGQKVGEYLRVLDVHAGGLNVAALTITLFFPSVTDVPTVITLQGVHSYVSGNEQGSVSASSIPNIVGVGFTGIAEATITFNFP